MKNHVSIEELNAAALLLTGTPVSRLAEIHVANSVVTVVSFEQDGTLQVARLLIGEPQPEETDEPEEAEAEDGDKD